MPVEPLPQMFKVRVGTAVGLIDMTGLIAHTAECQRQISATNGNGHDYGQVIIDEACRFWGITRATLMCKERTNVAAERRYVVFKVLVDFGYKCKAIARMMPINDNPKRPRDHSLVYYGVSKLEEWMETCDKVKKDYQRLSKNVKERLSKDNEPNHKQTTQ